MRDRLDSVVYIMPYTLSVLLLRRYLLRKTMDMEMNLGEKES